MLKNIQTIKSLKGKQTIVATTAYDSVMAKIADNAGVDILLVGDSVGTTHLGFDSTIKVTLDMMIHHTSAVVRADIDALVVSDLPYGYSHDSDKNIFDACRRLIQSGASAIKIEGGESIISIVKKLVSSGIPIMGHIGLMPQQIKSLGRYRKFGSSKNESDQLLKDALALESAGCFSIIGEMIDSKTSELIQKEINVPYIGIGSGPRCDGQILVSNDLLGLSVKPIPGFVRKFADLSTDTLKAFKSYKEAVQKGEFPNE